MYSHNFSIKECPYRDVCKYIDSEHCNTGCIRFQEIDYIFKMSGIPKVRQKPFRLLPEEIDKEAFEVLNRIKLHIEDFVNEGQNLYIYSCGFGNGKTSWSIKLLQNYFDKVWNGNGFTQRGLFVHVPTFLSQLKRNMSNVDDTFNDLIKDLISVDVVVWDDIAATKMSDYDYNTLLSYIDQRLLNGKCNIYTGNIIGEKLEMSVGPRLSSRIQESSLVVEIKGQDRRGSK